MILDMKIQPTRKGKQTQMRIPVAKKQKNLANGVSYSPIRPKRENFVGTTSATLKQEKRIRKQARTKVRKIKKQFNRRASIIM